MLFELFMPYPKGASIDIKDNLNGYYKTDQDYADALITEDSSNGAIVYNACQRFSNNSLNHDTYYLLNSWDKGPHKVDNRVSFAKAECTLYTPNELQFETVDSMIDKFVGQREFLVAAQINLNKADFIFEEELRQWYKETQNIHIAGRQLMKQGGSKQEKDMFIEQNIPRRQMRLSFLNNSEKRVNFVLRECEIEEKLTQTRYLFYVKRMEILK